MENRYDWGLPWLQWMATTSVVRFTALAVAAFMTVGTKSFSFAHSAGSSHAWVDIPYLAHQKVSDPTGNPHLV